MFKIAMANAVIFAACIVAFSAFFLMIRQQATVAGTRFLKSMIPHHNSAILMCERDAEIEDLCAAIIVKSAIENMADQKNNWFVGK